MKHVIFALLGLLFFAAPAAAQMANADIQKAENYLQGLKTAQADFVQSTSSGSRMSGKFYLSRPGKLRFNYNEVKDFIVADGVFVYFYDSQLGEQSNAPIGQTLADFILRKDLRLKGDLVVQQFQKKDGYDFITLAQKNDPLAGQVELIFAQEPYALHGWSVTDAQGETTEIVLKNLQTDVSFDEGKLFSYHDPKGRKITND